MRCIFDGWEHRLGSRTYTARLVSLLGRCGAVGAVPGLRNPICVARRLLLQDSDPVGLPLGMVRPVFMAGEGARAWAVRNGEDVWVHPEGPVTEQSRRAWEKWLGRYTMHHMSHQPTCVDEMQHRLDTVGAVCVDGEGACLLSLLLYDPMNRRQTGRWSFQRWSATQTVSSTNWHWTTLSIITCGSISPT